MARLSVKTLAAFLLLVEIAMFATLAAGKTCESPVLTVTVPFCPKSEQADQNCWVNCVDRYGPQVKAYCRAPVIGPIKDFFCWCRYPC
ncbi:hypothetical protein AgCh_039047 [Apium graveolens]